ncbi:uncharacterized protein LOC107026585 isoform X1 [Solanum pennellii]|uniref:Uncharacterized protein LOC107026585 isoform X1 n=1 Tax=Solanum pennellii TaxID=28526 RepID=A0ABM1HBD9_SOLPN|nr:uncharacterized protein LOC107026585 isoform X1 [Solanum pennellii]XP_015083092.1 uncharacterized protein LOC107026585 isoform X1 [Solanum pennellii]XP_027773968.1 uncharacterized protein LOC107026585 isoform X1 [Solanum pennellii]
MDKGAILEAGEGRNTVELVKSASEKHLDLLRPSARYYSVTKGQAGDAEDREKGKYTLIRDVEDLQTGFYDKPLPCFGCGVGWFSFLLGFLCPLMWYYATILYFGNYYRKDPRERAGLAASAIANLLSCAGNGVFCCLAYYSSNSLLVASAMQSFILLINVTCSVVKSNAIFGSKLSNCKCCYE